MGALDEKRPAAVLVVAVLVHVVLSTTLEPPPTNAHNGGAFGAAMGAFVAELVLVCVQAGALYALAAQTFLFRGGLYAQLARHFRVLLVAVAAHLVLFLAARLDRLVLYARQRSSAQVFGDAGYLTVFYIYRVVVVVYWLALLAAPRLAGSPDLHQPAIATTAKKRA